MGCLRARQRFVPQSGLARRCYEPKGIQRAVYSFARGQRVLDSSVTLVSGRACACVRCLPALVCHSPRLSALPPLAMGSSC
eukprot:11133234-Alexandrium_andersonii.AAC.1